MLDERASPGPTFERIVCGVDGTPASLVAVRQALRLLDPGGSLHLAAAVHLAEAAHAGIAATHAARLLRSEAQTALEEARVVAPSADTKIADGEPGAVLLREAESERASLVAVGSHGRRRAAGILLGTVAARVLRDATCSVLIAREARDEETWPRSVVVGVDGSAGSAAALTVARSVAERFGGSVRAVASLKDQVDPEAARAIAPELEEAPGRAVDVLAAASESGDLVVVGSRGLHGLKALGSVSERVAHQARSSVLVVHPVEM
jgi:nucleotide-binding universal stress UspA family protein